ncbi:cell division protein SepF [Ornithinimicrobium pekingense]|uniref:Cell division protein SepF n=1 Tax=Ornithinimicrobium pekingense TaxID=384677 RepID=A0ABQ2FAJ9_9MICO|nr:cell division protein SepF [Ornithinimicrobium pekingense]GGK68748.1 cell division protein SepF [Ornithinimicrobium pekingense]
MAGALRKTMEYLGLAESDERYDDYDAYDDTRREPVRDEAPVSPVRAVRDDEERPHVGAEVTPLPRRTPAKQVVREPQMSELNRITTIHPRTYNEAKNIGEAFRDGVPVIINLTDMDDADAKRLVDFSAGLAFGLHGSIERVTSKVFLLSPEYIEVDGGAETPARNAQGPFNQS